MSAGLTAAQARVVAVDLTALAAENEPQGVKDAALVDVFGRHGPDALLAVTAAACELLGQALAVHATGPGVPLSTVLDSLRRVLENEAADPGSA